MDYFSGMNNEGKYSTKVTATGVVLQDANIKVSVRKVSANNWTATTRYITKAIGYTTATYRTKKEALLAAEERFSSYEAAAIYKKARNRD